MAIMASLLGSGQMVYARDSQFTRQGAGPMYWISYEHQWTKNTYMPEQRLKDNIDWMAQNFLPYGYDMVSTDGWIEGATMLSENGYIVSHNDHWMTNPIDMTGTGGSNISSGKLVNGDFEDGETGWTFEGPALHGINATEQGAINSLWTWSWDPHTETISQKINNLPEGKYKVSARVKTKNGMSTNGSTAVMRIKGYDASNTNAVDETPITSETWTTYSKEIDVTTTGGIDLEFYYDSNGTYSAGIDLDDVTVEAVVPEAAWQYPTEKYPNGHTWKFWADYSKSKGLKYGVYYNPLWISPEVVKNPDKYTVVGHPEIKIADLVIKDPNGNPAGGDRFNGGQGNDRALYWLNVDAAGAEEFLKGYVKFFKDQGVSFLRVDFLSWYETGTDINIGNLGEAHTREQYDKAIKWMSEAAGEDMVLSLVMPNLKDHGEIERKYGDMIRINEDVFEGGWVHTSGRRQNWQGELWSQWAGSFQGLTGFSDINGRESLINDADFTRLNTFSGQYANNERKSEISLYTIAGAPIAIADQYDTIGDLAGFYQNTELIELNKMGLSGKPIFNTSAHYKDSRSRDSERWVGQLPDGTFLVGLFNRSDEQKAFTFDFDKELGISQGFVRDLWAHQDLGTKRSHTVMLDPHDCAIVKVVPTTQVKKYQAEIASYEGAKFNGPDYISGAQFGNTYAGYSGSGYVESIASSDDKVTFAVNAPKDGDYKFNINYANGGANATVDFYARDKVSGDTISTKETALPTVQALSLDKWGTAKQSLTLKKGINLITVQGKTGSINLDSIEMIAGESEATIVNGDFESGTTGWDKAGDGWWGTDSNDAYEGNKLYNYFPSLGEATVSQKITNVADGHYKVTAMVKLMPHTYPNFENGVCEFKITQPGLSDAVTNITPKVKDGVEIVEGQKIEAEGFEYVPYNVEADVTAGEMNIEFHTKAPKGDTSLQIDNVKIEKIGEQVEVSGVPLNNADFEAGFENWSRSNMVNQSIQKENGNSYVKVAGDAAYTSDLWQYAVPGAGNYTLKVKLRNYGDFNESSLYVRYSGGTKKVTIPKSNKWTTVLLPNVEVQNGEVIKLGTLVDGKAGSNLDIDDAQLVKSNPAEYQATSSLGNLSTENPYTVDGTGVIFNFDKAPKVKVDFMNDEIARVWMEPTGIFNKDKSFVVNNESAVVTPSVSDAGDYIKISTSVLTVRAYKAPFRIEYYDAANTKLITGEAEDGGLKYDGDTGVYATMKMGEDEHFYGLGMDRDSKTLDRAGQKIVMKNDMVGGDTSGNVSDISGTFFTSTKRYGIFFDNTYEKTTFDMGATNKNEYTFSAPNGEMVYYFMNGESLGKIMENYSQLSGKAPLPPKWALGYIQSKFGYESWDEVNEVVDKFREKGIPVDGMVLDTYWAPQNHYFDMSWSSNFANPKEAMDALAAKGIKMTNIVDPYVQVTSDIFQEGDKNGYFVKDSNGKTIIYDAWYGKSGLIDYTNPEASKWYANKVKQLHDAGVKGWWIDLNEPEKVTDSLRDQFKEGNASEIRNVYALNEAKAFYDGQRSYTDERVWSLARSGFSGIQEYGTTVWSGDINSTWNAFTHNLELGLSTGMSGMPYFTNDTGGFREGPPSAELYTRWMQATAFMPIFRAHGDDSANQGKGEREPWAFGAEAEGITTNVIKQRYKLLPYIYTTAKDTYETNKPIMRPLIMDYTNDAQVAKLQDQWMFGASMMVAPVHTEGATSRSVYLPQGTWYDWNDGTKKYKGGNSIDYAAPLDKIPVFVKSGSIIPIAQDMNYVGEKADDYIDLKVYPNASGEETKFSLYEDDGKTYSYEKAQSATTDITTKKRNGTIDLNIAAINGSYEGKVTARVWAAQVKVDSLDEAITKVNRNDVTLTKVDSIDKLNAGSDVWYYDDAAKTVYLRTRKVSTDAAQNISILTDTTPPIVSVEKTGNAIFAVSNEAGSIYLVPKDSSITNKDSLDAVVASGKGKVAATEGTGQISITTNDLVDGKYVVYAVDNSENVSTASSEVIIDYTPPAISVEKIGNTISVQSNEAGSVYLVPKESTITTKESLDAVVALGTGKVVTTEGTGQISITTIDVDEGKYVVYAVDNSGNVSTASSEVIVDNTPPTVSVEKTGITITVMSSEAGVLYLVPKDSTITTKESLDAIVAAGKGKAVITDGTGETSLPTTGLDKGKYVVYAVDNSGNVSNSSSKVVSVNEAGENNGGSKDKVEMSALIAALFGIKKHI
jgi:alpha-glucosidase (family GH31 glycosyl hydrolase)